MVEDIGQLLLLLEQGKLREHAHPNVQLKASWSQDNGKQLAARANDLKYPSGWMVIGVADDGKLLSRDEDWVSAEEEKASHHLNANLDPGMACTKLGCYQVSGSWVIVIAVSNPGTVVRWGGKPYKSAGTTALEMASDEAMELILKLPGLHDYSAQPWQGKIAVTEAHSFMLRILNAGRRGNTLAPVRHVPETALLEAGIKDRNAAKILFGDVACRVIVYDAGETVVLNTTIAPLCSLLEDAVQDSFSSFGRREVKTSLLWPRLALREAMANAVAHASYVERGGDLMIEVHPHAMFISNLCARESLAFANKWFSKSHNSANPLLMETLRLAGHVDELGRGKQLIMREFLVAGMSPPEVSIEPAGRFSRWRLKLPTGEANPRLLRLLERLKQYYDDDEKKAMIALALCLWKEKPYAQIRNCADEATQKSIDEIVADMGGPIWHNEATDSLRLLRWARLIIEEGVDSKQLSPGEEEMLYKFARHMQTRFDAGAITNKRLRELAQMGDTASEKRISSSLLTRWAESGKVQRMGRGKFQFPVEPPKVS